MTAKKEKIVMHLTNDNQAAIALTKNAKDHGRTKHIDIRHYFLREKVTGGEVYIQ